jgi:hypothetical protein
MLESAGLGDISTGVKALLDRSVHIHHPKVNCPLCITLLGHILRGAFEGRLEERIALTLDRLTRNQM